MSGYVNTNTWNLHLMKTNAIFTTVLASILLLGCEPYENANVESTFGKSKEASTRTGDGMTRFLGKWQNEDKAILLEITANEFHYVSSSESVDLTGKIQLSGDRLLVGRSEEDGGYAVLTDRGTLLMKQEHRPEWELELTKEDAQSNNTQSEITEESHGDKNSMSLIECGEQGFRGAGCQEHKEWLYGN